MKVMSKKLEEKYLPLQKLKERTSLQSNEMYPTIQEREKIISLRESFLMNLSHDI